MTEIICKCESCRNTTKLIKVRKERAYFECSMCNCLNTLEWVTENVSKYK